MEVLVILRQLNQENHQRLTIRRFDNISSSYLINSFVFLNKIRISLKSLKVIVLMNRKD